MRLFKSGLFALLLGLAGASPALAGSQNATGCPTGAWTDWSRPGGVSLSWSFRGIPAVLAFHPTGIVYGGGVAPLSPAQVLKYAPTLDNLRAAAQARVAVTVYWDDATNLVSTIIVRWDQPC